MAASSAETAPSCPLDRWDSAFMVVAAREPRDLVVVRKVSNPNRAERQFCHHTSHANRPILSREIVFAVVALKDVCDQLIAQGPGLEPNLKFRGGAQTLKTCFICSPLTQRRVSTSVFPSICSSLLLRLRYIPKVPICHLLSTQGKLNARMTSSVRVMRTKVKRNTLMPRMPLAEI